MLDDALVQIKAVVQAVVVPCLNPCYAGRCSSTFGTLNLMEISLNVSILVMLDDALVLEKHRLY